MLFFVLEPVAGASLDCAVIMYIGGDLAILNFNSYMYVQNPYFVINTSSTLIDNANTYYASRHTSMMHFGMEGLNKKLDVDKEKRA